MSSVGCVRDASLRDDLPVYLARAWCQSIPVVHMPFALSSTGSHRDASREKSRPQARDWTWFTLFAGSAGGGRDAAATAQFRAGQVPRAGAGRGWQRRRRGRDDGAKCRCRSIRSWPVSTFSAVQHQVRALRRSCQARRGCMAHSARSRCSPSQKPLVEADQHKHGAVL
jgi:hypothetical protein